MLGALLQNNNNAQAQPQSWTVKNVRDSVGPNRPHAAPEPQYEIVDIITATATFPEIAGEDPVTRAARRVQWISEALPFVRGTREKREAAAFLAGATLAERAVREEFAAAQKLSIEQMIQIVDAVRRPQLPMPVPAPAATAQRTRNRGEVTNNTAIAIGLVLGGMLLGSALLKARKPRRR
jgi:hypothetical protein